MRFLYCISIRLYALAIFFASFFNEKAKKLHYAQKSLFNNLPLYKNKTIWIHVASLGEFEQARPIIEAIKSKNNDAIIHLSFFSPSGYEIRKNYDLVDSVSYLPFDTVSNAKEFIKRINPEIAIFVKYDFWFNLLNELQKNRIKTTFISAIFRENQHFFKTYGFWFKKHLKKIDMFFTQDENSKLLLNSIGIENVVKNGDTRFDRVLDISYKPKSIKVFDEFKNNNKKTLILGSSWPEDERIVSDFFDKNKADFNLIIAPHQIDENHINEIKNLFKSYEPVCFSELNDNSNLKSNVIIVDKIGLLMHIYQYADLAYIGGGFGVGIHNILEAAVFGLPVIFGPNYQKFKEAKDLISLKGALSINNLNEFEEAIYHLTKIDNLNKTSRICADYVKNGSGATKLIISYLESLVKI